MAQGRAKAGTSPQHFLTLEPQSTNVIVNIGSELLAPVQTPASACAGGVEQQG